MKRNDRNWLHICKLNKSDIFNFKCRKCGKCCYNHSDIILTPFDLYGISEKLKISTEDVIKNYCIIGIGQMSLLPLVYIKNGKCPFNTKEGCAIDEHKPSVCKMYPMGRNFEDDRIQYFSQPVDCGDIAPTQTTAQWLESNGITEENEHFTEIWYKLIIKLTMFVYERKFSPSELEAFQRLMVSMLYLCYNVNIPFYEQFLDHKACIEHVMNNL